MKKIACLALLLLAGAAAVSAGQIPFAENPAVAFQTALEKNQPVVITFYADW